MAVPAEQLDRVFGALSDPTRRAILARLANGEATVNELVDLAQLRQPTVSKHLKVLERAGLVTRGRTAQFRPVRLNPAPLASARQIVTACVSGRNQASDCPQAGMLSSGKNTPENTNIT